MHHMVTVLLAAGTITHIINDTGAAVTNGTMTSYSPNWREARRRVRSAAPL